MLNIEYVWVDMWGVTAKMTGGFWGCDVPRGRCVMAGIPAIRDQTRVTPG